MKRKKKKIATLLLTALVFGNPCGINAQEVEIDKEAYEYRQANPLSESAYDTVYTARMYKVGKDIPVGEYKLFAEDSGYFSISTDSNGDDILFNDNFKTFTYVTLEDGDYFTLKRSFAVPVAEVPPYKVDEIYEPGLYKVGFDIPAGEYYVETEESGYYALLYSSRDGSDNIITNDNFENGTYVTIEDGQYLDLSRSIIDLTNQ